MKLIPAWAGSVIFHLFGLLLLFLFAHSSSEIRGAPGIERTDNIGIVLKSDSNDGGAGGSGGLGGSGNSSYRNETGIFGPNPQAAESPTEILEPLTTSQMSFSPDQVLPKVHGSIIGPTSVGFGGDAGQSDRLLSGGPGRGLGGSGFGNGFGNGIGNGTGNGNGSGLGATVGVFGLEGTGYKFAFVFDRSDSMRDPASKPIRAAKAELIQAIDSLKDVHQLLVVFYNEEPAIYPSGEQSGRLIFATDDNKEAAKRFIQSIVPSGGTNHEKALTVAAKQNPDVIFLLTDGEPKDDLNAAQWDRISRVTRSTQINVIQFGLGPEPQSRNYLKRLATENAGQYQYIEIGTL